MLRLLPLPRGKVATRPSGVKTGQGFPPWTDVTPTAAHTGPADHRIAALAAGMAPPDTGTTT